jgi:hypothetical protein
LCQREQEPVFGLGGKSSAVFVMAGLDPAIHVLIAGPGNSWMPGTAPGHDATLIVQ